MVCTEDFRSSYEVSVAFNFLARLRKGRHALLLDCSLVEPPRQEEAA